MAVVLAESPHPDPDPDTVSADAVVCAIKVLIGWLQRVAPPTDDAATVNRIAAFEQLQAAAAGAQLLEIDRLATGCQSWDLVRP